MTTIDLTEVVASQSYDIELLQESIAELTLALEDVGWQRIGDEHKEFSYDARKRIVELSRTMSLKNPLVKRGIAVQAAYVWGQDATMRAADERVDAVIQAFLSDEKNADELTSHQAKLQKEKELQTDGNLFFVLFPNISTGAVRIRTIPVGEITDIITNPEDAKDPWYYKRVWQQSAIDPKSGEVKTTQRTAYYPDWRYTPKKKPKSIGSSTVEWSTPIYHVKVGGFSDWKFGCSEVYAAIDWARAYKDFLEDWATFTRAISRYAMQLTVQGGKRSVTAAKTKLSTTLANGANLTPDTNPPPVAGSTFIGADGTKMAPMAIGGANVSMEDGRRMLLMVAAAQNLPETFYGDVSVGTLATATSLDRPTELQMKSRQTLWADIYQALFSFVIQWAVRAPSGLLRGLAVPVLESDGDEIVTTLRWKEETGADGKTNPIDPATEVTFPPVVAPDRAADVNAVVAGATAAVQNMDRKSYLQLIFAALGVPNVDALIDQIDQAMQEEEAKQQAQADLAHQRAVELAVAQPEQEQPNNAATDQADVSANG